MDSKEVEERLEKGELPVCPECDLFYPESETCQIICCANPFVGYSDLELEAYGELTIKNFNYFYGKKTKAEKDLVVALSGDKEALKRLSENNLIFEIPNKKDK